MSTRHGAMTLGVAVMCLGGCVSTSGSGGPQGARLSDDLVVYAPFDNERDWGPSYLIGAPYHHLGYGVRIDDTRSIPDEAATASADPNRPPQSSASPQPSPRSPQPSPQPLP